MLFDIHSHIIHDIDDGAENLEESLKLLEMLGQQGVDVVAATPHFYADEVDFKYYTEKVNKNFEILKNNLTPNLPKVIKGYEVRYFKGISGTSVVKELTLGGSPYLLLEFTYGQEITPKVVGDIADVYYNFGLTPILAHIERYYKYHGFKYALKLVEDGIAMAHVNASSFTEGYKRAALKLVDSGIATLIASDTHSVLARPPMFDEAKQVIAKNLGDGVAEQLFTNSERIYNEIVKLGK